MNKFTFVFIFSLFFIALNAEEYSLVWSDEFNEDGSPNKELWNYENGFVRNNELQWYQQDNAYCKDGHLIIEGRKENRPNPLFEKNSDERNVKQFNTPLPQSIHVERKSSYMVGLKYERAYH